MRAGIFLGVALAMAAPLTVWDVLSDTGRATSAATVDGRVRDADSGDPIGGAQVFVDGTVVATLTGADGHFELEIPDTSIRGGSVTITARVVGFDDRSATVALASGSTATVDFLLSRSRPGTEDLDDREGEQPVAGQKAGDVRADVPATSAVAELRTRNEPIGIAGGVAGRVSASATAPHPSSPGGFNTESYAHIAENGWLSPGDVPLSTFSIDVDRASYSNVRRFLTRGERPPIDAVRIEEMVNYFSYDYPEASGEHPFTVSTEVARAPWNEENLLVRVGIQGTRVDLEDLPSSNLVFLLDVSGSMGSPDKLPLLKRSLRLLVNELRPDDRVAIVVYAGAAGLVLESTSGRHRERILGALEELEAGGSTAGGAGLQLAYKIARRNHIEGGNNRVILATDGDFNVGASSDSEMIRLIEGRRDQGTFLTVLGFGSGNLKDSKMEAIADHGNGNYAYIDNLLEARKVLVTEMGGTLVTIAKDVKIQVEFNPVRVQAYRLIGYENRLLAAEDFNDDTKDAGELGAGHTVTALYEVVPPGARGFRTRSIDPLRYEGDGDRGIDRADVTSDSGELLFVKLRYKRPNGDTSVRIDHAVQDRVTRASADMQFAAAVAAFGMILRGSEHIGDFRLPDVARLARGAIGPDLNGYRSEFLHLVEQTRKAELVAINH
jgi:Ca-activated chloride channel family protein